MLALCESCHCVVAVYHIVHNLAGENLGEFGKTNVLHQYFTQPNSRFIEVAMLTIKIRQHFPCQNSETTNSPKFSPRI